MESEKNNLLKQESPDHAMLLDPAHIRERLEKPIAVQDLPALNILEHQINCNAEDIAQKLPGASYEMTALSLAERFRRIGMYQRIAEQPLFGPRDFERVDNPERLKQYMPLISERFTKMTARIETEGRDTIAREDGWLHISRGNPGKTAYRIYLSPKPMACAEVFNALERAIPEGVGFKMKTFDRPSQAADVVRLDKIIIYASAGDFDAILKKIEEVHSANPDAFERRPSPGGGALSPLEGVSIGRQPEKNGQREVTGAEEIADTMQKALSAKLMVYAKNECHHIRSEAEFGASDFGKIFWSALQKSGQELRWFLAPGELETRQSQTLSDIFLRTLYGLGARSLLAGGQISEDEFKTYFLKELGRSGEYFSPEQKKQLESKKSIDQAILTGGNSKILFEGALQSTGLALGFLKQLRSGQSPGAFLGRVLQDPLSL